MTFIKQTLKNTASLLLAVGIIGSAYAAISTVSSGDPLTADSWNQIVNKISNTDTNSDDLVTKSYVDATISANSGISRTIDWSDCQVKTTEADEVNTRGTATCSTGYGLVDHSCNIFTDDRTTSCTLTDVNTLTIYHSQYSTRRQAHGSIKCCKINP